MMRFRTGIAGLVAFASILLSTASATTLASLSFDELTDKADVVVSGTITRSWVAWDPEHKYIWTHYEAAVISTIKGTPAKSVEFVEVGGTLDGIVLRVPGTVAYQVDEKVLVFLTRYPNGQLRTTGWGQGKYTIDANNRLHGDSSLKDVDIRTVQTGTKPVPAAAAKSLDGSALNEAAQRVLTRVRARAQGVK